MTTAGDRTGLSEVALANIPSDVATPDYERRDVTVGIVHIGVGGFHRSHEAMYVDRLLRHGDHSEWGICGVGLLPHDALMRDSMTAQDCLYTLALKHPDGTRDLAIIGSIIEYLFAPDDPEAVIERMADPQVRIVSLTITEGGYNIDAVTGEFDAQNPRVVADALQESAPTTVFGFVVAALALRRVRGIPPFTVLSCDNIQGNGDVARRSFSAYARLCDPELGAWVHDVVAFPNSMVDRITPVTTDDDRVTIASKLGIHDACPVVSEPFAQWVLEDHFPLGRPRFEEAGVQLVGDVEPYELMKLRLLNATHQGMCYFGFLAGYRFAHEASADPAIAQFLLDYMDYEAVPTLREVPGVDLSEYTRTLIDRYRNPEVRDTLARLCAESSDRIPKWLLPVVHEQLAKGGDIHRCAAIVASWARYAEATDEAGAPIEVVDRLRDELLPRAQRQREAPRTFIENRALFGDLVDDQRFVTAYLRALSSLHEHGSLATVRSLVAGSLA